MARGATLTRDPGPATVQGSDLKHNLNYMDTLAELGVERDPETGELVRWVVDPTLNDDTGPLERMRFVALTRQDAQAKSRSGSTPWDWYCTGLKCPQCIEPMVGWVRSSMGGLKFEREHDHISRDRRVTVRRRRGAAVAPAPVEG